MHLLVVLLFINRKFLRKCDILSSNSLIFILWHMLIQQVLIHYLRSINNLLRIEQSCFLNWCPFIFICYVYISHFDLSNIQIRSERVLFRIRLPQFLPNLEVINQLNTENLFLRSCLNLLLFYGFSIIILHPIQYNNEVIRCSDVLIRLTQLRLRLFRQLKLDISRLVVFDPKSH